jgi:hypothetical protein
LIGRLWSLSASLIFDTTCCGMRALISCAASISWAA